MSRGVQTTYLVAPKADDASSIALGKTNHSSNSHHEEEEQQGDSQQKSESARERDTLTLGVQDSDGVAISLQPMHNTDPPDSGGGGGGGGSADTRPSNPNEARRYSLQASDSRVKRAVQRGGDAEQQEVASATVVGVDASSNIGLASPPLSHALSASTSSSSSTSAANTSPISSQTPSNNHAATANANIPTAAAAGNTSVASVAAAPPSSSPDAAPASPASSAAAAAAAVSMPPVVPSNPGVPIGITSGHFSMQGIRPEMEDRVTLLPHPQFNRAGNLTEQAGLNRSFFAVFDGHGGDVSAEYCRQHVHMNLLSSPEFRKGTLAEGLKQALLKTERDFCAACRRINLLSSSGTTAVSAYIENDRLYVGNVGDSRAVLCRSGRAVDASIDHKPGRKEERIRIEALGGRVGITEEDAFRSTPRACNCIWACVSAGRPLRVFPGGLSVSRTIGDISMKNAAAGMSGPLISPEPELWECRLGEPDEFLILACDGVWDVMSSQAAVDVVRGCLYRSNNEEVEDAAKMLANEAFRRGSTDNISVIVIVFHQPKDSSSANAGKRK